VVGSRTLTAAVGLLGSLAVSLFLWWQFDTLAVFLLLPVVPLLFRGWGDHEDDETVRTCPACGFRTTAAEFDYCPRDGTRLASRGRETDHRPGDDGP
jgi:hypothetical protein